MSSKTFIIDCPRCKARVAAIEQGRATRRGFDEDVGEPYAVMLVVGSCPSCDSLLAGESRQVDFANYDAEYDRWSDVVRVYPKPPKEFLSYRIPRVVTASLAEADKSLQVGAHIAACVMLGRALEAVCRNVLEPSDSNAAKTDEKPATKKKLMLAEGIKKLKEKGYIDDRLFDWSQQLHAFRNLAAHPEDITISREDAGDLQTFVYAIAEYIYDLTDRYNDFKERVEARTQKKKA